jgi:isopenicillin N synthase-like dioxygenase
LEEDLPQTATAQNVQIFGEYAEVLERVKVQLLECIAMGLELPKSNVWWICIRRATVCCDCCITTRLKAMMQQTVTNIMTSDWQKANEAKASCAEPTICCKAHSDYESITLLLIEGTPGLQAFVHGE